MNGKEKIKALDDTAGDIGVGVTDLIVDGQQIEGIDTIIVINPRMCEISPNPANISSLVLLDL